MMYARGCLFIALPLCHGATLARVNSWWDRGWDPCWSHNGLTCQNSISPYWQWRLFLCTEKLIKIFFFCLALNCSLNFCIWITSGWEWVRGRIVTVVRSYLVNMPSGTIRRNRQHLQCLPECDNLAVPGSSPEPTEDINSPLPPNNTELAEGDSSPLPSNGNANQLTRPSGQHNHRLVQPSFLLRDTILRGRCDRMDWTTLACKNRAYGT